MKGSRIYIIFIVVLLVILVALEYNMPKSFRWNPTYSQYDKQPFGAAVFDDILSHSLPDGYSVVTKTFYQLDQDSLQNTAILAVDNYMSLDSVDMESLFNLVERGNKAMLVAGGFGYLMEDSLNFSADHRYFHISNLRHYVMNQLSRDTIVWIEDSLYQEHEYYIYPHIRGGDFDYTDSVSTTLAEVIYENSTRWPVGIRYTLGEGELYLLSTPLMFTNYGILDQNNSQFIFRYLTQMKGMPLIRTEGYNTEISAEPQTPFRYFLSQPPLRWGIYLTLVALILFMVFTAKRQQRVIPVVEPPGNKSLEFVELIGTLYFQKKESAALVRKKYIFFAETLRRTIQVDLDDGADDQEHARVISSKTGIEVEKISRLIISLRRVNESSDPYMTDELMKDYIDRMNEIINMS